MSKLIDLTGRKFGRLTVICRSGTYQRPSGNKEPTWRCKCECGNEVVVMSSNLKRNGNTLSCGCLQTENRFGARRETECEVREDVVYVKTFEGSAFIVSSCDLDTVKLHRWRINAGGYITDERGHTIHRTLMSPPAVMDVHHINGNKLDNRRSNLLILSRSEHTALHQQKDIANGVTVQKWIPVSERLPEPDVDVLAFNGDYIFISQYFRSHFGSWDEVGHMCWMKDQYAKNPTHWMPLPEPPKGE